MFHVLDGWDHQKPIWQLSDTYLTPRFIRWDNEAATGGGHEEDQDTFQREIANVIAQARNLLHEEGGCSEADVASKELMTTNRHLSYIRICHNASDILYAAS